MRLEFLQRWEAVLHAEVLQIALIIRIVETMFVDRGTVLTLITLASSIICSSCGCAPNVDSSPLDGGLKVIWIVVVGFGRLRCLCFCI